MQCLSRRQHARWESAIYLLIPKKKKKGINSKILICNYAGKTAASVAADKQRQTRRTPLIRHWAPPDGLALASHGRIITGGCTFVLVSSSGDKVRCSKVILECPSPPRTGYKSHLLAWQEIAWHYGTAPASRRSPLACRWRSLALGHAQISNLLCLSLPNLGIMYNAPTVDSNRESCTEWRGGKKQANPSLHLANREPLVRMCEMRCAYWAEVVIKMARRICR